MSGDVTVVHVGEPWPEHWSTSVYLCGPTPRDPALDSWRPHAEHLLREHWSGEGRLAVFLPEAPDGQSEPPYPQQVAWEEAAMHAADAILFYVPRDLATLPGLVTNVKWGAWHDCGRAVLGSPPGAQRNEYLLHFAELLAVPVAHDLPGAVTAALALAGPGARREGADRHVPLALWRSPEFRDWHAGLAGRGDALLGGRLLWSRGNPVTDWVFEARLRSAATGLERTELASRAGEPPPAHPAHLAPLGTTGWSVWRDVMLRGAGFPASDLTALASPALAAAADLAADGDPTAAADYKHAYDRAVDDLRAAVGRTAGATAFREAVLWQNQAVVHHHLHKAAAGGPRNAQGRRNELVIASYLQRYTLKNDTIGWFGPVGWARCTDADGPLTVRPGPALTAERHTFFENWAVDALAATVARTPGVLPWLVPRPVASHARRGHTLLRPRRPSRELTDDELALLELCDGRRTTAEVTAAAPGGPRAALPVLVRLHEEGIVRLDLTGPVEARPEHTLRRALARIGDPEVRARALAPVDRLVRLREDVAAAAGDPDRLDPALTALRGAFEDITARDATRRAGADYAGRTLVYEDTARDVQVGLGTPLISELAAPLGLLLDSADWLVRRVADGYRDLFDALYDRETRRTGEPGVPLAWLVALAADQLSTGHRSVPPPVERAVTEFQDRWRRVLPLPGTARHTVTAAALAEGVAREFPAGPLPWAAATHHCPDLMIAATGPQAVADGDWEGVLGELHVATNTLEGRAFVDRHPDPERLLRAAEADYAGRRVYAVPPKDSLFVSSRLAPPSALLSPAYRYWSWAEGQDSAEVPGTPLPAGGLRVCREDGGLVVRADDGTRVPLLEAVGEFLSAAVAGAFSPFARAPHRPRVTVGRLVVARESWSVPVAALGWVRETDEAARFAAARRWRAELGLPERVFYRVPHELKPMAGDFGSLALVNLMARTVRAVPDGPDATVTLTEMYPGPDRLWLPDAAGARYTSELRFVATRAGSHRTERVSSSTSA
ncbi:lantibiotic dehydratase [Streptomyces sp. LP11]|uniref:Lantibiotic dehydratase n=1 Tax=Streptomyces pyxinicus TaxID=2970331 RepID=A0ABT2AXG6_9ACTN|nr:lantibiotic dehydratase [Streptomyces sp. LP11]MCS0600860.1 lantibiotic dehydratase [Streptomyces sp. LP11]